MGEVTVDRGGHFAMVFSGFLAVSNKSVIIHRVTLF